MTDDPHAPPPEPSPHVRRASVGLRIIGAAYLLRTAAMLVATLRPWIPGSFVIGSAALLWGAGFVWLGNHLNESRPRRWAPHVLGVLAVALAASAVCSHLRPFGNTELHVTLWISVVAHLAAFRLALLARRPGT